MGVLDDFFSEGGKCARCGGPCDTDRELCPACLAEAQRKPKPDTKPDTKPGGKK